MEHVSAVLTAGTTSSSVIVQSSQDEGIALGTSVSGTTLSLHTPPLRTPPPPPPPSQVTPLSSLTAQSTVTQTPQLQLQSLRPPGPPTPVLSPPPKSVGRNHNGTMVTTSTPSNEAELQLYRVLQRASLLSYYDTLLEMGGDDVQQLCDAGEEEFLEIMALVGMATKPLHVRRLQKALHEWVNDPSSFQTPLSIDAPRTPVQSPESNVPVHSAFSCQPYSPTSITGSCSVASSSNIGSVSSMASTSSILPQIGTTPALQMSPALTESQINRLIAAAEKISRELPQLEPRAQSSKKRTSKHVEQLLAMSECDPRRMDEIRKYAAIYGRFDCKRKPEKPLTLHEVCVNEAAAQICKFVPALLTRRDELFPLARQVVRDSGFRHSAEIARFSMGQPSASTTAAQEPTEQNQPKRQRRFSDAGSELSKETSEKVRSNPLSIYQKLGKASWLGIFPKYTSEFDEDSRFSFSNSSSPPLQSSNGSCYDTHETEITDEDNKNISMDQSKYSISTTDTSTLGVHVISASGNQIIAVANPALVMSNAILEPLSIKRETMSPEL